MKWRRSKGAKLTTCGDHGGRKPDGSPCGRLARRGPCPAHAGKARSTGALQRAFIAALAQTGNITAAAEAAGISRDSHYRWLEDDPEYAEVVDLALDEAADRLEIEARRRAVDGVLEPVFYKGKAVGAVRKQSDRLLEFLLKAARPEKYRERHDVRGEMNLSWPDVLKRMQEERDAPPEE